MISDKNKKNFLNSHYANEEIAFMSDAFFSINNSKLFNGAIFLSKNSLIFMSKNYDREIILGALKISGEKRGLVYHKITLEDNIDNLKVNIDFFNKSVKTKFMDTFDLVNQVLIDNYNSKKDSVEIADETQSDNKEIPYEELKQLKELLDMDVITQEEFDIKKKELLNL
ncbi:MULTISPECIES: SHOCT domain-containing protein [unclassified Staphylococcus]|uniref:SHOCT domain-containing protein n=2 Tax=Staphylococcus TaxID=1279 RepID=UPI00194F7625|nr:MULTISPECIES: SHOCT domain-containing protein [unclassified Staphylococcus]